jgi:hypothetical protein
MVLFLDLKIPWPERTYPLTYALILMPDLSISDFKFRRPKLSGSDSFFRELTNGYKCRRMTNKPGC